MGMARNSRYLVYTLRCGLRRTSFSALIDALAAAIQAKASSSSRRV
jgi:hypothetical protein